MTTAADVVEETRAILLSGARENLNRLGAAIVSTAATTATMGFAGVARGDVLAVDLELIYVWAAAGTAVSDMARGWLGSTAATHLVSTLAYVNPKWSTFRIFQAVNEELASLSSPRSGLFRVQTVDLTYSPVRSGYDLTGVTGLLDVIKVEATGIVPGELTPLRSWRVARNMITTDFASGTALELFEGGYPGKTVRVTYKAPYTALSALSGDLVVDAGLHAQAHDIVPLGAAGRLLMARESRRATLDSQPEPRQAADVPGGTARNAASGLLALRDRRLSEEAARLRAQYPTMLQRVAG